MFVSCGSHSSNTCEATYILDFFDCKVSIRWYADLFWLDIDDHEQRIWCISFEKFIDLEI